MSSRIADAEQRAAALNPNLSFIVQAPAGSGKTELLIRRMLVLLAAVDAPEEVLAITFTRKAAGEMQARIMSALRLAAQGRQAETEHERTTLALADHVLNRSRDLGWELESSPSRLRVQTIDSLCSGLVSRMPLLSKMGFKSCICEDPQRLYMQAARSTLEELENDTRKNSAWSSSLKILMHHLDNDHDKVCRLISAMLPKREQWLRHLADPGSKRLQRMHLEQALIRAVEESLREVRDLIPEDDAAALLELTVYGASNLCGNNRPASLKEFIRTGKMPGCSAGDHHLWRDLAWFCLTQEGRFRIKADKNLGFPAPGKSRDKEIKNLCQTMKEKFSACMRSLSQIPGLADKLHDLRLLPEPGYTEEQWKVLEALFDVLRLAAGYLQLVFQDRKEVDFVEITSRSLQALGSENEPTDLALILDNSIRHLLMDEFQDTSISQFLLLRALSTGWMPGDGRTFFAVGDPMQSIYGFREAEVGLFLQAAKTGLGHIFLKRLTLSLNFRSRSGIVNWVNKAFPSVLPSEEDPLTGSIPYSPSRAFNETKDPVSVSIHPFFDADYELESSKVVSIIHQAIEDYPQDTIAVLVRSRSHLKAVVPALHRCKISFQAVEIDPLSSRPVIQDLCSLAKALRHPGHDLAWLAVLRAPWSGLELADLAKIRDKDRKTSIPGRIMDEKVLAALSSHGKKVLGRIGPVLRNVLEQNDRTGLRRQVESCWHALGGPDCLQSPNDRVDADVFFKLLQNRFEQVPHELVDELDKTVATLFAQPDTGKEHRLQIMTMHRAKGLEFDTVILPGLGRGSGSEDHHLLVWMERSGPGGLNDLLMAPVTAAGEDIDPVYAYIRRLSRRKSRNEDGRLLYVAATRARKRLHILGHTGIDAQGKIRSPTSGTLLSALWPAVRDEFEKAAEEKKSCNPEADKSNTSFSSAHSLYRLKFDWRPPDLPLGLGSGKLMDYNSSQENIAFDWAGELVRCVGICVHRWLMVMTRQGVEAWNVSRVRELRQTFVRQLVESGLTSGDSKKGAELVVESLENILLDRIGQWILGTQREARNEYAISGSVKDRTVSVVMDRTFVDESGVRWIIDYKTSRHQGGDKKAFLDREITRYQDRMEMYARLMQDIDARPIRLGLYFPLLSGWREWEYMKSGPV